MIAHKQKAIFALMFTGHFLAINKTTCFTKACRGLGQDNITTTKSNVEKQQEQSENRTSILDINQHVLVIN